MNGIDDDERGLSPAESLRLIQAQQADTARRLFLDPLGYYIPWGLAWLVGFAAVFLRTELGGRRISEGLSLTILFTSLGAALAVSVFFTLRRGQQVRGGSQESGMSYGLSWSAAYLMVGAVASRFGADLPPDEASLLWSALSVGVAGVLFMAGAAVWRDRWMLFLGAWISAVNFAGTLAGPGWHPLVSSLAGGGGLLATGVLLSLRQRRGQAA